MLFPLRIPRAFVHDDKIREMSKYEGEDIYLTETTEDGFIVS